jgi:small conductance mechanosensitive channel
VAAHPISPPEDRSLDFTVSQTASPRATHATAQRQSSENNSLRRLAGLLLCILAALSAALPAAGQATTTQVQSSQSATTTLASVHGHVTDVSSAVVPDATITLTNATTGASGTTKSDNKGAFAFTNLSPGTEYEIEISALGYPRYESALFTLSAGENLQETLRLDPKQPFLARLERDWQNDVLVMVQDRLPKVLFSLLVLFIFERVVRFFVNRLRRTADRGTRDPFRANQLRTMASIIRATAYSILGFLAFLQLLYLLNVNIAPILASAGIVGVGVGLAAQSLFKDIINGVFILVEDQYNVGETVKIASLTGTVEDLTLRLTRLRDGDGTLYIIPNSQVATVSNLSRDFAIASLNVSVDASAPATRVIALLKEVAQTVRTDAAYKDIAMTDPEVPGIDTINGRTLVYPISMKVKVNQKDALLRAMRLQIVETFKREGIPLGIDPGTLLLQQTATAADPTAPPTQQPLVHS